MTVRDATDDRILLTTEALIAEHGYDGVRLIDIADSAGVSIGSLQHRYRNRERLLTAAVIQADERSRSELLAAAGTLQDPWDRLMALLDHLATGHIDGYQTAYWLELIAAGARNAELVEIMRDQQGYWLATFQEILEAGLDSGRLVSDLGSADLTLATLAVIDGLFASRALGAVYRDPEWSRRLLRTVVEQLVQPAVTC